jgi:multisubunit Na+/H+ antiporter MnhC subunit
MICEIRGWSAKAAMLWVTMGRPAKLANCLGQDPPARSPLPAATMIAAIVIAGGISTQICCAAT